ncbi:hypothetical protein R1T08_03750 [Streptomyces sp. SBC-4]|nr:hypothetical protein [Streptomyces sp. SBC-4]MDV5143427.1 hypothetical protein [Streptomyces sp. SBC-4]
MPALRKRDPLLLRIATLPLEEPASGSHATWLTRDFPTAGTEEISPGTSRASPPTPSSGSR